MNPDPLVSVIVPAYNHEKYINDCLRSVADQSYENLELIVINDGSADNTPELIKLFIAENPRLNIRFLSKSNEGVCKTLNKGLEMAAGKYVTFLASDDMWEPEKLKTQVDFMERNANLGLVFTDAWFLRFTERMNIKWSDYKNGIDKYFKNGVQNADMYFLLLIRPIIPALTVMVRKKVFDETGGFDEKLVYEDLDMWLRIARKYPLGYIDSPLARYRIHDSNISNDTLLMMKGLLQTLKKHSAQMPLRSQPLRRGVLLMRLSFNLISDRIRKMKKRGGEI